MRDTATNAAIEAPNSIQSSPALTLSSTGAPNSLTNGSHTDLQGALISEDYNSVQTLSDQLAEDAAWGTGVDLDGIHILTPQAADAKHVHECSNLLSWPLSVTETDWQLDFDMPLIAEPTDASTIDTTTFTDIDMSPLHNRSTQGLKSTDSSGDLIGYLNLSDEVRDLDKALSSISEFLPRSSFDNYVEQARGRSQGSLLLTSLISSVMAVGYCALLTCKQRAVGLDERKQANYYAKLALRSRNAVANSPDSLLKLQTMLAMVTAAEQADDTTYSGLLTGATSCARALRLENQTLMPKEDRDLASKCLWFLYSIEVPHSLHRGLPPALDHDWFDHAPPQASKDTDWFQIQCLYATVLSSIIRMLYNQQTLRQSLVEREQKLEKAYTLLKGWKSQLPISVQEIHKHDMWRTLDDTQTRHMALSMFRQYHEAIFIFYFPWTGGQSNGKVSDEWRRKSMELCVNSAHEVLAVANQASSQDILDRWADDN
ncbi:MAG: hypothetical protein M1822_007716 [Bathelium mastoideum]|nr:MAG: hypothetical protein M1822_007716 [Bathelium mastoideum]